MPSNTPPRTPSEAEARAAGREKRATDAVRAVNEAEAEARRVEENTTRLRALRMARDAKAAADLAANPAPKGKAASKAGSKAKPKAAKAISAKKLNARNDG